MAQVALVAGLLCAGTARADQTNFQLDRYEPTAAGEWFFSVEHPWYSSTRYFAAGLTLDYGHNPLAAGTKDASGNYTQTVSVVQSQLVGHVDVAGSFLDRVALSLSLPVTLFEAGTPAGGAAPVGGPAVGDPRVGLMVRVYGQPARDALSIHLGGNLWIPIGATGSHAGDSVARVLPKLVLGGLGANHSLRWAFSVGYLIRGEASAGTGLSFGNAVGSELQLGAALGWASQNGRWNIGPEAVLSTIPSAGKAGHSFATDYTSLELSAGAHYLIADTVLVGASVGLGLLRELGTPDARGLIRIAWAPVRREKPKPPVVIDTDGDGVPDPIDACPAVRGVATADPRTNGCPPPPPPDTDHDGIADAEDQCPSVPFGDYPDPDRRGCPIPDTDGDGVIDPADKCPKVPAGPHPTPEHPGCPDADSDEDGVYDHDDRCPDEPPGPKPDPKRPGCPQPDRDGDNVLDDVDACPDKAGAPDLDPKKNGCPGLVQVKNGMIVILTPVYFASGQDVILEKSFPVLNAVANAMKAQASIERVSVEGHTDNKGQPANNLALSQRRAASVMRWLIVHGIEVTRLEAHGYGQTRPIDDNRTDQGRATNRRVDFRIITSGTVRP